MITPAASATFRKSYLLDLGLYNDEQQDVLYITDDPAGHNLHLDITNASGQAVLLSTTGITSNAVASATNCHFALRFRPGTLSPTFQSYVAFAVSALQGGAPVAPADATLHTFATETQVALQAALHQQGWSVGYAQESSSTDVLYFLSPQAQTLAPGTTFSIIFPHASAAGGGGARSTRVELNYQHVSLDNNATLINGTRQSQLTIVNQRGQKNIPLHVSFVGANAILNDGKAQNTLTLRITNILKGTAIALNSAISSAPSKFVFSFDVQADGDTTDWALGTTSQVRAIKMDTTDPAHWRVNPSSGQEQTPEWILTVLPSKPSLAPNEEVTLTLSNILSSLPPGLTNLYISYENIPGYWDGQFAIPLEKTPLLYRGANVGIGIANPTNQLSVTAQASFGGNGKNAGGEPIEVQGPSAGVSYLDRSGGATGRWVIYSDRTGGPGTETLRFWTGGDKVAITQAGNVGIGTDTPHGALEIGPNVLNANAWAYFQGNANGVANPSKEIEQGLMFTWNPSGGQGESQLLYATGLGASPRLDFGRWDGTTKTIDMTLNGGHVGIGTNSPYAPLEVKGTDFQFSITNAQNHNWSLTNWTDDKLYFQYREQGQYKNNAMELDKTGQMTLTSLMIGGNSLQQGINWTGIHEGNVNVAPLVSSSGLRILGNGGGVLAVNEGDVMCWASYGVVVKGDIWARNKYFRIAHPEKPDAYLIHACLEGPESSVYYRGRAQLSDGRATIHLPPYFESLTRQEGRTVLLTPEGREPYLLSYEAIVDGIFRVYGTRPDGAFSWEVKAVRADVERLEPEIEK